MDPVSDYYSILGIARDATDIEIKRAYRRMVFRYHPDRNPDDTAAVRFKEILDAYDTLSDSSKRSSYDREIGGAGGEDAAKEAGGGRFGDGMRSGFSHSYDFKTHKSVEPQPKCPHCAVIGTDHIVSRKGGTNGARGKQFVLSPFNVIFCSACGHVYGVIGSAAS